MSQGSEPGFAGCLNCQDFLRIAHLATYASSDAEVHSHILPGLLENIAQKLFSSQHLQRSRNRSGHNLPEILHIEQANPRTSGHLAQKFILVISD